MLEKQLNQEKIGKMLKVILSILSLGVFLHVTAQKPHVILSINPVTVGAGEAFTITVKSNVQGEIDIDNLPSSFGYGYDMMQGMEQEVDYNTGQVITYYYMSQTGTIATPGKYSIGPAYVKNGNKSYASNKVKVTVEKQTPMSVGSVSAQQFRDPAFGTIQTNKTELYEGEPVIVSAKIYSRFSPSQLSSYSPYKMKGTVESYSLGNNSNIAITEEKFRGDRFYTFEYDRQIIFPGATGTVLIDPFKMNLFKVYQSFPLTSSAGVLNIKPLPENPPGDFIGGVGNFDVSRVIDTTLMKQGDVFQMLVTVEGAGNLQNILEPTLNLPKGLIVYGDPKVTETISYSSRGAEGSKTYEYNIQVSRYGNVTIPATTISFFDPVNEEYVQSTTDEHIMKVKRDAKYVIAEAEESAKNDDEGIVQQVTLRMKQDVRPESNLFGSAAFWSGVGAPLLSAILFVFFARRKEQNAEESIAKTVIKEKGKQSNEYLQKSKSLMTSGDNDGFFSNVEMALKKAFEVKMNLQQDRILNKQEIYSYLDNSGQTELKQRVQRLFSTCESSRFGFGTTNTAKQESYEELVGILKVIGS